jgi:undecaprenyl-diphosphatase
MTPVFDHATRLAVRFRLNELGPLISVAAVSLGLWGFAELAGEVSQGGTAGIDRRILLGLRNPDDLSDPIGPTWFEEAARDMTALGGHAVLGIVSLATLAYLMMTGKRQAALFLLVAVGGGMLLSAGLKLGFERARPDLVPHHARVYTASFPSGHAMLSAVVYLTLAALLARVQSERRVKTMIIVLAVLLTLLVGMSRVYLGVHWPTDVLAGWCGGAAWASLCWFVALQLQRRGRVEHANRDPQQRQNHMQRVA